MNDGGGTGPEVWCILAHTPGPRWQPGRPPGEQDGFDEHGEFLDRLKAAGHLVAAGPLPASPGRGQTVIRGVDATEARRLATVDDRSVASGLLHVEVLEWLVVERG